MKKIFLWTVIAFLFYVGSYVWFRGAHIEVWEKNGRRYVIFPKGNVTVYYFYRPLTYIDGAITGMDFHIGPHQ